MMLLKGDEGILCFSLRKNDIIIPSVLRYRKIVFLWKFFEF